MKMEPEVVQAAEAAEQDAKNLKRRKRLFLLFGALALKAGIGYGIYAYGYASRYVSTDNAYTSAETAQVTPAIGGIVREVRVTDTQQVKQGDVVVVLDDTDAALALAQAQAE